jgi:hypothetical protein
MSQTCPLCRDPIGRVSHGGIAITDAQRERIIASYKLFDMTVNPDLSGICITERRSMLASVTGTHSHTKHDLKFDGAPVYLLLKGFRYNRVTPPYPENLGFVFRVDDESTRSQLAALSCITSDYSLVRQTTPGNQPYFCVKTDDHSCYFRDGIAATEIPKAGIVNAIVRPLAITIQGKNVLQLCIVQAAFEKYQEPKDALSIYDHVPHSNVQPNPT